MRRFLIALLVIFALTATTLLAQDNPGEKRSFGLTFPNIGVIWHITKNIAFQPDVSLSHNWSKLSSTGFSNPTSETDGNGVAVNAGLRFYIQEWKGVRFYLTPRYGYNWVNNDISTTSNGGGNSENRTHAISGSWGVQYAINDWISLFGDIGAGYAHGSSDSSNQIITGNGTSVSGSSQTTNSVSTTGRWGLILYLK